MGLLQRKHLEISAETGIRQMTCYRFAFKRQHLHEQAKLSSEIEISR